MQRNTFPSITRPGKRFLSGVAWGATAVVFVASILVFGTLISEGRSPAERAMTSLVMPVALLWQSSLFVAIVAWRWRRYQWGLFAIAMWFFFGILFNGNFAGAFLRTLEHPTFADPAEGVTDPLSTVVLLGGFGAKNRFGVPEVSSDGQRLVFAAQLWHAGKTRSIICTGTGQEPWGNPSEIGRRMLVSLGVPENVIFEVPGPNTAAEMESLKQYFADPPDKWLKASGSATSAGIPINGPRIGLITNVVHMSRAMRLAKVHGLEFVPLPCRLRGASEQAFSLRDLIPTAEAGEIFAIAQKEWMASWVGR